MSVEIVRANPDSLRDLAPAAQEMGVTLYLADARDRLVLALQESGPETVAQLRAELATVAEMTKQLGLSKEIREDADEMVRRSEYGLGKAIRAGQEAGEIRTQGRNERRYPSSSAGTAEELASPYDYAAHSTLYGDGTQGGGNGVYAMAEATEEEFEVAIEVAKEEHNLSRANVVRKVRGLSDGAPVTRAIKADVIADLAQRGYTSSQMVAELDTSAITIRIIAREYGIDIHGDKATGKRRALDSGRILEGCVNSLEAAAFSIRQINMADLDRESAQEWVDSLTDSLNTLRREIKKIKESFHDQA